MKTAIILFFLFFNFLLYAQENETLNGESWKISEGTLVLKEHPKDILAEKYWSYLKNTLPEEILNKYISSLRLFTDGKDEELGGVTSMNEMNTKWEMDIDTLDFSFSNKDPLHVKDYTHTIIHEFGHLLTLNSKQIEVTKDTCQDDAKGYLTKEGYATHKSYLGKFVTLFWNGKLLKKWDNIERVNSEKRKLNLLYKLYLKNKDQFLTDYAAESPEEDIAESWTFFVLSDKPVLDKIKHKKVLFFYQFEEFVNYRQAIREQLELIPTGYIESFNFKI